MHCLWLPDKEVDQGMVDEREGCSGQVRRIIRRKVGGVFGPLYEAEHNGVFLPGQELSHWCEIELVVLLIESSAAADGRKGEEGEGIEERVRSHGHEAWLPARVSELPPPLLCFFIYLQLASFFLFIFLYL